MINKKISIKFFIFIVVAIFLIFIASAAISNMTDVFTIKYTNGTLSPSNLKLFNSPFSENSNRNEGDYHADVVKGNKVLYSVKFEVNPLIIPSINPECINETTGEVTCDIGPMIKDEFYIILNLPYFAEADSIKVYDNNTLLFTYRLKEPPTSFKDFFMNKTVLIVASVLLLIAIIFVILYTRKKDQTNQY